jgi:hypothetical protein
MPNRTAIRICQRTSSAVRSLCSSRVGCFGLIATNTIGQGDTRSTGLRWICGNGGVIYRARKRYKWPGQAAVVSVVHVHKGSIAGPYILDGHLVDRFTAYLFHAGGSDDPERLAANEHKSFQGSIVLGMGFTFDDTDKKGVASPLSVMQRLIAKDPRNAERIFPYIGGEDVNDSPTYAHHRYVINFEDFPLLRKESGDSWFDLTEETRRAHLQEGIVAPNYPRPVAADWPDLLAIVEERVKPARNRDKREIRRKYWWKWGERTPALFEALKLRTSTLALSRVGQTMGVARISAAQVGAETIVFFPFAKQTAFAVMQSQTHGNWARFMASSMKDDLRYTPSDCFETFPFPANLETHIPLETAGEQYYDYRSALMVRNNEGRPRPTTASTIPVRWKPTSLNCGAFTMRWIGLCSMRMAGPNSNQSVTSFQSSTMTRTTKSPAARESVSATDGLTISATTFSPDC